MKRWPIILYILAWVFYIAITMTMMPLWGESVVILIIPLLAIGGWLFGTNLGLRLIILEIIYHYILFSEVHADIFIYYQSKFVGILISIAIVQLTGNLRKNLGAIKETGLKLDRLVAERNRDLDALASKLIIDSEQMRISRGQALHDGIGQHMTGIQLFGSSLADQLAEENNLNSASASLLVELGSKTHNQIRHIARVLFPVQIAQVGLVPALQELASCFGDLEQVNFSITEVGCLPDLSENTALQLYRICQESANHAIYQLKATKIEVEIATTKNLCTVKFGHNGLPRHAEEKNNTLQLIDYRLQQISGCSKIDSSCLGFEKNIYTIPNPEMAVSA